MNIVIKEIPKEMDISEKNISFSVFATKFVDYMEDLEDIESY